MKTHITLLLLSVAVIAYMWRDTFDPESLRGSRVLVTGASTGIGEQMAYHYARFGAQLVITARRESALQKVAEKCLSLGAKHALSVPGDMSLPGDPVRVLKLAVEKLGGLDILVLNHIGASPFAMWDGDLEHIRWLMEVNFHSYVAMAHTALPHLEKSAGSLVVVSSLLGKMTSPFVAPYSATKFALNGFFGTLQHELAMRGSRVSVTINTLGLIDTESAMEKVRVYTNISAYPASDAALHIIHAGATRQVESFCPWYMQCACFIRDWFPTLRDLIIRNFYTY